MKNHIKMLRRSKGFTLVECVVAIAVFAVMTVIVMMILGMARGTTSNAQKAEKDLDNLIENVVTNNTHERYSKNSEKLELSFSGSVITGSSDFSVTYNAIDGYNNYVLCASCGTLANNTEFMGTNEVKDFDPASTPYECPACGFKFNQQLECTGCGNIAKNSDSTFIYDRITGSYACNLCNGTSVRGVGIGKAVTADSDFHISGMSANAIRYSTVEWIYDGITESDAKAKKCEGRVSIKKADDGETVIGDKVPMQFKYKSNGPSTPGTYRIELQPHFADSTERTVKITLPGNYKATILRNSSNVDGNVGLTDSEDYSNSSLKSYLSVTCKSGQDIWIEFTLINFMNGFSFDYDYRNANSDMAGLTGYWLGLDATTFNCPAVPGGGDINVKEITASHVYENKDEA